MSHLIAHRPSHTRRSIEKLRILELLLQILLFWFPNKNNFSGIYFAEHSSKSNQYVFGMAGSGCSLHHDRSCYICVRHLLFCRVTLGKCFVQVRTIHFCEIISVEIISVLLLS